MPKTKKLEEKRGARFSVSVAYDTDSKLEKLAISCEMSKSELVDLICKSAVNSPEYIMKLQNRFNRNEKYRVIPVTYMGKLRYE